jgi:hypothetical protein
VAREDTQVRRRARRRASGDNLDSFLDILTNTVGVLIFVLLFVALTAADASVLIRTPLRQDSNKDPEFFEVRGDRIYRIDTDAVDAEWDRYYERLPPITIYNYRSVTYRLESFETRTENHRVDFTGSVLAGGGGLRYRLRTDAVGNRKTELRDSTSTYQANLARLDTSEHFVAFVVRPDGFEAFREARKQAWKRGLQVGWEPMADKKDLTFGSRGRQVGTQ